jgi:hypothetical protein
MFVRNVISQLLVTILLLGSAAFAQPPKPSVNPRVIAMPNEEKVARHYVDTILNRLLPNGTFRQFVQNDDV